MSQVSPYLRKSSVGYIFYCPGCKEAHHYCTSGTGPIWTFNGDVNKPSFTPSLRLFETDVGTEHTLCHLFVTDGQIQFCSDCDHELRDTTVPLPELPEFMQSDRYGDGNP